MEISSNMLTDSLSLEANQNQKNITSAYDERAEDKLNGFSHNASNHSKGNVNSTNSNQLGITLPEKPRESIHAEEEDDREYYSKGYPDEHLKHRSADRPEHHPVDHHENGSEDNQQGHPEDHLKDIIPWEFCELPTQDTTEDVEESYAAVGSTDDTNVGEGHLEEDQPFLHEPPNPEDVTPWEFAAPPPDRPKSRGKREDYDPSDSNNSSNQDDILVQGPDSSILPIRPQMSGSDEDPSFDEFEMTDDQREAMLELEKLKAELIDDDFPFYNVQERLAEINAALAQDEGPPEERNGTRVLFKADLVDMVIPPTDYSSDEEADVAGESGSKELSDIQGDVAALVKEHPTVDDDNWSAGDQDNRYSDVTHNTSSLDNGNCTASSNGKDSQDEVIENNITKQNTVLVERDGEYILANKAEMEADMRNSGLFDDQDDDGGSGSTRSSNSMNLETSTSDSRRAKRVASAPNRSRARLQVESGPSLRASSAGSRTEKLTKDYSSPYGMSEEEKKIREKRLQEKEKQRKREEEKKKDEENQNKQANEMAFRSWLASKREEAARARHQEDEKQKQDQKERSDSDFFKEWLKRKKKQQKQEQRMKERERQEMEGFYDTKSREECNRAFKEWLRCKNKQARQKQDAEKERLRLSRLQLRRSRKSRALARAIEEANMLNNV